MADSLSNSRLNPSFFLLTISGALLMLLGMMSLVGGPVRIAGPNAGAWILGLGVVLDIIGALSLVKASPRARNTKRAREQDSSPATVVRRR